MNKKKISSDIQNNIKLNKMNGELLSKAKISECFHHNKSECNGTIKKAHSIQRNGKLSLLEEKDENDNSVLYSFTNTKVEDNKLTLKPIGKAIASTFNGFCDFHDNKVFSPIEDASFKNTDEQCFLYSYRAFAHTHHRKTEQIKAYSAKTDFKKGLTNTIKWYLANEEWLFSVTDSRYDGKRLGRIK